MSFRKVLLAATIISLPLGAQAQQATGFYLGGGIGLSWLQDTTIDLRVPGAAPGTNSANASFRWEPAFVVSLGYAYGNGFRAELEFSHRLNDVDRINGFGIDNKSARHIGRVRTFGFMVNALYDIDLGPGAFMVPYVGVGAGYLRQDYDNVQQAAAAPLQITQLTGGEWTFGYQAIIGAAFPVPQIGTGLSLTAEYRFTGSLDLNTDGYRWTAAGRQRGDAGVSNANHALFVGFRQSFGAAPAPAAPAVAPAPARTFLVFFDFDRADLTDRARQIIGEAAQSAQRTGTTRIEVSGHADRSGTPQYNQRLSERRAQAVAAELERRGVPRSAMAIQAFGESRPLVPTADGVREPQNRRVEIVLR